MRLVPAAACAVLLALGARPGAGAATCGGCAFSTDLAGRLLRAPPACECSNALVLSPRAGLERPVRELPEGIFLNLTSVSSLDLSHNALGSLRGGVFEGLSNLEVLVLDGNDITELQDEVLLPVARTLRKLSLAGNRLPAIRRDDLQRLSVLEELDLSSNAIAALEDDVFAGSRARLQSLWLGSNLLVELPPAAFAGFGFLETLNVSSNALARLPGAVFNASSMLTSIDLSGNALTAVPPDVFAGLSSVRAVSVFLDHNSIQSLAARAFAGLDSTSPGGVSIHLSSNEISSLAPDAFAGMRRLTFLDLSSNRITEIAPSAFDGTAFKQLKILHLSSNEIAVLPKSVFKSLKLCHTLLLGNNRLAQVETGLLAGMQSLKVLSLGNNQIAQIPSGAFMDFQESAREIILAHNKLRSLPRGLFSSMTHLRVLVLGDNPFDRPSALPDLPFLNSLRSLAVLDLHNIDPVVFAGLVKMRWPLATGSEQGCENCKFSRHVNGSLLRDVEEAACRACQALDFDQPRPASVSDAFLRDVRKDVFKGMSGLRRLNLGRNALSSLPQEWFDGALPNLALVDMVGTIHQELGAPVFSCVPAHSNSSSPFRANVRFGGGVGLTNRAAGVWPMLGVCPPGCCEGTFFDSTDKACVKCQAGSFSSGVGGAACLKCPPAKYMPAVGASACVPCPDQSNAPTGSTGCTCNPEFEPTISDGGFECSERPATLVLGEGEQGNQSPSPSAENASIASAKEIHSASISTDTVLVVSCTLGALLVATCVLVCTMRYFCARLPGGARQATAGCDDAAAVDAAAMEPAHLDDVRSVHDDDDEVLDLTPYVKPAAQENVGLREPDTLLLPPTEVDSCLFSEESDEADGHTGQSQVVTPQNEDNAGYTPSIYGIRLAPLPTRARQRTVLNPDAVDQGWRSISSGRAGEARTNDDPAS